MIGLDFLDLCIQQIGGWDTAFFILFMSLCVLHIQCLLMHAPRSSEKKACKLTTRNLLVFAMSPL